MNLFIVKTQILPPLDGLAFTIDQIKTAIGDKTRIGVGFGIPAEPGEEPTPAELVFFKSTLTKAINAKKTIDSLELPGTTTTVREW